MLFNMVYDNSSQINDIATASASEVGKREGALGRSSVSR